MPAPDSPNPPRRRADVLLVERGVFESRAKAQEAIAAGLVRAQGRLLAKPSETLRADAEIEAAAPYPWVSRGGVKLEAALDAFGYDPAGLSCLDVGASTGGFTHVLLARGASSVVAVDVGRGQLHPSLRSDRRVLSLEATDVRVLGPDALPAPAGLIVVDVSFISLALVLPALAALAAPGAALVALIKPQFEAGRAHVAKGVVRDPAVHAAVCACVTRDVAALGWRVAGVIPSPIEGGDGNREFLIGARRC
ncbi:TlyA family RNA methyltransferase [Methylocella sp.]|uniref:TlyA family RNA methyltransferase n=1 Tax=Methylocella sp. TaxID=1978226 RepID=UPI0035B37998